MHNKPTSALNSLCSFIHLVCQCANVHLVSKTKPLFLLLFISVGSRCNVHYSCQCYFILHIYLCLFQPIPHTHTEPVTQIYLLLYISVPTRVLISYQYCRCYSCIIKICFCLTSNWIFICSYYVPSIYNNFLVLVFTFFWTQ